MAIDTTIQFNGHNSYKVTELLLAYPFGVQNMTYITHAFQVYCNTPLASATRAKTKFLDADGATLSEVSHAFAVPAVFTKAEITVAVPATAVKAQLCFIHGGTDWWFAEPKSEEGQTSTPYNVNHAGQLTYITPNGVYTGMVTAGQIVVTGSIAQPDEDLATRLVTINNNAVNLTATVGSLSGDVNDHETRVTTIEAGQITLSSRVGAVEPKVTKITSAGIYTGEVVATQITSGTISADRIAVKSITGAKMADGTIEKAKLGTTMIDGGYLLTSLIDVDTLIAQMVLTNDLVAARLMTVAGSNNYGEIGSLSGRGIGLDLFADGVAFLSLVKFGDGGFALYDGAGEHVRISCDNNGSVVIRGGSFFQALDSSGKIRISHSSDSTRLYSPNGLNMLIINNTDAYKSINGVVTQL